MATENNDPDAPIIWDTSIVADQQARTIITILYEQYRVMVQRISQLESQLSHERQLRQNLRDDFSTHKTRANH